MNIKFKINFFRIDFIKFKNFNYKTVIRYFGFITLLKKKINTWIVSHRKHPLVREVSKRKLMGRDSSGGQMILS